MKIKLDGSELKRMLDNKDDQVRSLVNEIKDFLRQEEALLSISQDISRGTVIHLQHKGKNCDSTMPDFFVAFNAAFKRNNRIKQEIAKQYKNTIEDILQSEGGE